MNRNFIEKIYVDYYEFVKTIITYSIHSSNSDDITSCVQEVFLIAMQKEDLSSYRSVKAWLLITAKNVAKMFNRNKAIRSKHIVFSEDLENFELIQPDCSDLIIDKINFQRLKDLDINQIILESLSLNERDFYRLLYHKKMSIKEISLKLHISEGAAATRCTRLREKIKKVLKNL